MNTVDHKSSFESRMAARLKQLRTERSWSLDDLAQRCDISRASISRLENAEVSPTAAVLGQLCAAFGLPMSRLIALVEAEFTPLIPRGDQAVWNDPETGFIRRTVSPPAETLAGEVLECELPPGKTIEYPRPPRAGLEHHLILAKGQLSLTIDGQVHALKAGDCLRYKLHGASTFNTPKKSGAKYYLYLV